MSKNFATHSVPVSNSAQHPFSTNITAFIAIAMVLACLGVFMNAGVSYKQSHWRPAMGRIEVSSSFRSKAELTFEITPDREITVKIDGDWTRGSSVLIYFNPEDPQDILISGTSYHWLFLFSGFFFVAGLIYFKSSQWNSRSSN